MHRGVLRHAAWLIPLVCGLWILDNALSEDRYAGWERNSVRNSERRWAQRPKAKLAVVGSSTSMDWVDPRGLAKLLGYKPQEFLDAHINGCHQGCTLAEARLLKQRGYHFEKVFFGTNLFQMCEYPHSKRVLQQQIMTPALRAPELFADYLRAEQPLRYMGRFVGMTLSGAYGDTAVLQRRWAKGLFGEGKRGQEWRWVLKKRPPTSAEDHTCDYEPASIALKARMTAELLDLLGELADEAYLMLLPDRTLDGADDELERRWATHRALHERLAAERPHVTLVDLVTDGVTSRKDYRDSIHLNRKAFARQRKLLAKRLRELGVVEP